MTRARRPSRNSIDAAERWAASPSVQGLGADFSLRGFELMPKVRVFKRVDGSHTVRLVWRHRDQTCLIVLTVRA